MLNNLIAVAAIILMLLGCATGGSKTVTGQGVEDVVVTFQKGELRLTCETACSGAWGAARKQVKSLYENRLWNDLVVEVARVGHRVDLAYFYLGVSAEELGYLDAARIYFSLALANRYKCNAFINNCDGFDVSSESNNALIRLPKPVTATATAAKSNPSTQSAGGGSGASAVLAAPQISPTTVVRSPAKILPVPAVPPAPKVETVRSELYGTVKTEYDEFKKQTRFTGANVASDNDYVALRAWRSDKGQTDIQIYVADYYLGEWRFYNSAWDSDGTKLDFIGISRDVGNCSRYSGCSHTEHVGLNVTKSYLEKKRTSGIRFKLGGKAGEEVFTFPAEHIAAFLEVLKQQ